ncbi:hypothetical protein TNCV_2209481 [Trichonephila clavipes]|nr:hypothetical protein TNCV_2209481 [Trichonephila clavipes]
MGTSAKNCSCDPDEDLIAGISEAVAIKNHHTEQLLCKTSLTWDTNDAQLNYGGDRWGTPNTTHVLCFVYPVWPDRPF